MKRIRHDSDETFVPCTIPPPACPPDSLFLERQSEAAEQRELVKYLKQRGVRTFTCTLGGAVSKYNKDAAGYITGTPDMLIMVARAGFHGLAIELKATKGHRRATLEQLEFIDNLRKEGWHARVVKGYLKARALIALYLDGDPPGMDEDLEPYAQAERERFERERDKLLHEFASSARALTSRTCKPTVRRSRRGSQCHRPVLRHTSV